MKVHIKNFFEWRTVSKKWRQKQAKVHAHFAVDQGAYAHLDYADEVEKRMAEALPEKKPEQRRSNQSRQIGRKAGFFFRYLISFVSLFLIMKRSEDKGMV
ncbi:hypothetical protein ACEQPO_24750 [Bacillus sp. SL00103]